MLAPTVFPVIKREVESTGKTDSCSKARLLVVVKEKEGEDVAVSRKAAMSLVWSLIYERGCCGGCSREETRSVLTGVLRCEEGAKPCVQGSNTNAIAKNILTKDLVNVMVFLASWEIVLWKAQLLL